MKFFIAILILSFSLPSFAKNFRRQNREVVNFLENHEVRRVTNYCRTDFLNCRSVVQYRNKETGQNVNSFEDRFIASTNSRSVSFRGFFIEQPNGKFNIYSQQKLVPEVDIDSVLPQNQGATVIFDVNSNLPAFQVHFLIVGTGEVVSDFLVYDPSYATFLSDGFAIPLISQTTH